MVATGACEPEVCLFDSQLGERLGVHGSATLSSRAVGGARVRAMETPVVEVTDPAGTNAASESETEIIEELLVEEISIDGMCGVY